MILAVSESDGEFSPLLGSPGPGSPIIGSPRYGSPSRSTPSQSLCVEDRPSSPITQSPGYEPPTNTSSQSLHTENIDNDENENKLGTPEITMLPVSDSSEYVLKVRT